MVLHNRLTHSLKVEQVGTSLYTKLDDEFDLDGIADSDAVAAACLAHDLGHPPFGHAGESELNALVTCAGHRNSARPLLERQSNPCPNCLLEDGFEGNAQSFRIVATLAAHKDSDLGDEPLGLDLTARTLRATTKYPWLRGGNPGKPKKWGAYDCDAHILNSLTDRPERSLDAQLMDWADDIAYAVHDIEDFYRTAHIPLADYAKDSDALARFVAYVESPTALGELAAEVKTEFERLLDFLPRSRFEGTAGDHRILDKTRSHLMTTFIGGASVSANQLNIEPGTESLNAMVKQLIWFHVIHGPQLTNIQTGQRRVLREIFDALAPQALAAFGVTESHESSADAEQKQRQLPHALRRNIDIARQQKKSPYNDRQKVYRGLLDYIAGLSDHEAYEEHSVLYGRPSSGHL